MQNKRENGKATMRGIRLVTISREYNWDSETQKYVVEQDIMLERAFECYFEKASEKTIRGMLVHLDTMMGLDMQMLGEAYECVFYDCDDERCRNGRIKDGLSLSISYVLVDNDLLVSRVDSERMLRHIDEKGLATKERDDRIMYLSRFIESAGENACKDILNTITVLAAGMNNLFG